MSNNKENKIKLRTSKRPGEVISGKSPERKKTRVNSPIATTTAIHLHRNSPSTRIKLSWDKANTGKEDVATPTKKLSVEAGDQPRRQP